jgi:putative membrane protein
MSIESLKEGFIEIPWMKKAIVVFTIVVYGLVMVLHEIDFNIETPSFAYYLPKFHAFLNGSTFVALIMALVFIKKGDVKSHKKMTTTAMLLSVVFLLSYVVYHTLAKSTPYGGEYETLYYSILVSHIILAGLSLPFILFAYYRGFIGDKIKHKKLVRFTFPIWLYVALTGVLVYLFLAPYYQI